MPFGRTSFSGDGRLPQPLREGDGFVANVGVTENAADADLILTTAQLSGGFITQTTTLTAPRTLTTPTATEIDAEFPTMDVGDSFMFSVSSAQFSAFNTIVAGGTGVTLQGVGNVVAESSRMFALVKRGVATYDLF